MKSKRADNKQDLTALFSETESARLDKRVVRFTVADSTIGRLKKQIELQYPDLAIVRLPTHRVDLVNDIYRSFNDVFLGDCIVEYRIDLEKKSVSKNRGPKRLTMVKADETHIDDLDQLIRHSFSDYKNHYSHNPTLKEFDLVSIYQEWVRSTVTNPDKTCLLFLSKKVLCGFFAAEKTGGVYTGLLSGVTPEHRGAGIFKGIIRTAKSVFLEDGASEIVTNVLLENRPVHKVLLEEGFVTSNSFFTIHLNLRTSHTLPPSRKWGKRFASLASAPTRRRSRFTDLTHNS